MDVYIILPYDFIVKSTHEELQYLRDSMRDSSYYREYERKYLVTLETLEVIKEEAVQQGIKKISRAAEALLAYSQPDADLNMPCPNFLAFFGMLTIYLDRTFQDGWLYRTHKDGCTYAEAIGGLEYNDGSSHRDKTVGVMLRTTYYGPKSASQWTRLTGDYHFGPGDVTNRRIPNILAASDLITETPELRKAYDATNTRFHELVFDGFAEQYVFTGTAVRQRDSWNVEYDVVDNRKVIHDTEAKEFPPLDANATYPTNDAVISVPLHPIVRIFDLKVHTFILANSDFLTPYVYNDDLSKRLVLPNDHRDLLDILTTDLDAFLGDVVEGKSAGNVILSKGPPGVGKTLTAEIYSEMIHKPLYSIHSGSLGTSPDTVNKQLTEVFKRSKRWDCVLLLDEADVFVMQRGSDIVLNAIVAEFLRAMEYFDGLLFMTTNRPDDIDDAILSRCAAIIDYKRPEPENAWKIWQVLAKNYKTELSNDLTAELVAGFPNASGRDIKMLFRLALRVSHARGVPLTLELFRKCAMFRGVQGKTKFERQAA